MLKLSSRALLYFSMVGVSYVLLQLVESGFGRGVSLVLMGLFAKLAVDSMFKKSKGY